MIRRARATWDLILRVLMKSVLLLVLATVLSAMLGLTTQGFEMTLYNSIFPGRTRLPYGDDPQRSYNVTLVDLDAMLASHEIAGSPEREDEFRVLLFGDSSIWGFLQLPDMTLTAKLNEAGVILEDGRTARFYNLGYPTMSLFKDLLVLQKGLSYHPDLILWFVTLESFPKKDQLDAPLVQWNSKAARELIQNQHLALSSADDRFIEQSVWDRTIFGSRKVIMDQIRHQIYAIMWAATGIDHEIPEIYPSPRTDLSEDPVFHGYDPEDLELEDLSFDILEAGMAIAGEVPVILINEPIFIAPNADVGIRYNFYYPRWAYDFYRSALLRVGRENGWTLIDLWNLLPPSSFTDTAIHTNEQGTEVMAEALLSELQLDSNRRTK